MKILLIYPPWLRLFGLSMPDFPLNLGYLAAELRKNGHDAVIYNADFDSSNAGDLSVDPEIVMMSNYNSYMAILQDIKHPIWQQLRETVQAIAPDIVGITSKTSAYGSAINAAKCVKQVSDNIIVVLGGVHPTLLPKETIREPEVDLVVTGEAELTFVKLIEAIEKKTLSSIGIQYGNNKYIVNPIPGLNVADIDSLGLPARDLLLNAEDFPPNAFGTLIGSRGCPFHCIFCSSHKMWGRKVRFRTAPNIVEEIEAVNKSFGTYRFHFADDTFTLKKDLVLKFCKCMKEKGIKVWWSCPTRVDFIEPELVREMKSAGCGTISLGIESGSEDSLKRIRKGITVEQVRRAVKVIKEEDIMVNGYFVFGFPWETEEHITKTLNLIEELDLDMVQYNFAVPLPGTELYQMMEGQGKLPPHQTPMDWSQFYQHSPCMLSPKLADNKDTKSIFEYIGTYLNELNQNKRMLRSKRNETISGINRIKYYLRHPVKLTNRFKKIFTK